MLSKNQIKFIKSLQQKKFRSEHKLFVAEGTRLVGDLVLSNIIRCRQLYASEEWLLKNTVEKGIAQVVTEKELQQLSGLETPNEVLAVCEIPGTDIEQALLHKDIILVLDDVRDPGNLGTIIRIADWFGISHIICSENTVDAYNPKVVQASMGSVARVQLHYTGLSPFLRQKKEEGVPVYAALLKGNNVYNEKLNPQGILIMGNEAAGISEEVLAYITHPLTIPAFAHSTPHYTQAESLNVAVATAVLCSEFRKIA